ncbi:hypothetical protein KKB18_06800 [bacterium]|nr:hypothetical protein [bacterium]
MLDSLGCFVGGVLIDLDHIFDFMVIHDVEEYSIKRFMKPHLWKRTNKIYLFFHSYEMLIPAWIIFYFTGLSNFGLAFTLGFLLHLWMDHFLNRDYPIYPFSHFLIFKLSKHFKFDELFQVHLFKEDSPNKR